MPQRATIAQMLLRLALILSFMLIPVALFAQFSSVSPSQKGRDKGVYKPGIWVDPDGCEHWVMDDGAEGYMTPHVNRNGIPVCHNATLCANLPSDQFFASGSAEISTEGQVRLARFFRTAHAKSFVITGHTDSRTSDAANLALSIRRAEAVARIAKAAGADVSEVRGYGERRPAASNATPRGMARNRRVEIMCIK